MMVRISLMLFLALTGCGYEAKEKILPESNGATNLPREDTAGGILRTDADTVSTDLGPGEVKKFPSPDADESDPGILLSEEYEAEGDYEPSELSMEGEVVSSKSDGHQHGNPGVSANTIQNPGDRKVIFTPEITNPANEEGTVSVEVKVDKDGKVISAKAVRDQKTNTANQMLIDEARRIAYRYKFEPDEIDETTTEVVHIRFEK